MHKETNNHNQVGQSTPVMASRAVSDGLMDSLLGLIGRERNPNTPENIGQVPTSELLAAMDEARGVDPTRFANIRDMVERRNPSRPLTSAEPIQAAPQEAEEEFSLLDPLAPLRNSLGNAPQ